jgi:hypothetical protein
MVTHYHAAALKFPVFQRTELGRNLAIEPPFKRELRDGDRILNFKFKPNSVSVPQFLPKSEENGK